MQDYDKGPGNQSDNKDPFAQLRAALEDPKNRDIFKALHDQLPQEHAGHSHEATEPGLSEVSGPSRSTYSGDSTATDRSTYRASPHHVGGSKLWNLIKDVCASQSSYVVARELEKKDAKIFSNGEPGTDFNKSVHKWDNRLAYAAYAVGATVGAFCGISIFSVSLSAAGPQAIAAGVICGILAANYLRFGSMHLVHGIAARLNPQAHAKSAYFAYVSKTDGKRTARDPMQLKGTQDYQVDIGAGYLNSIGGDVISGKTQQQTDLPGMAQLFRKQ